jgi:hypothetical protein
LHSSSFGLSHSITRGAQLVSQHERLKILTVDMDGMEGRGKGRKERILGVTGRRVWGTENKRDSI